MVHTQSSRLVDQPIMTRLPQRSRLPNKHLFKSAYLDAVGEPAASPRRHVTRGAEWAYTLNPGDSAREVAVVLLDGRYDRTPLPCSVRRDL